MVPSIRISLCPVIMSVGLTLAPKTRSSSKSSLFLQGSKMAAILAGLAHPGPALRRKRAGLI